MAKKNFNTMMDGPKKGLDLLIQPTTKATGSSRQTVTDDMEKDVHSNYVMKRIYHKQLKDLANNRRVPLKVILEEAISDYLKKNKDLL